jgi:hypothetical protein
MLERSMGIAGACFAPTNVSVDYSFQLSGPQFLHLEEKDQPASEVLDGGIAVW